MPISIRAPHGAGAAAGCCGQAKIQLHGMHLYGTMTNTNSVDDSACYAIASALQAIQLPHLLKASAKLQAASGLCCPCSNRAAMFGRLIHMSTTGRTLCICSRACNLSSPCWSSGGIGRYREEQLVLKA